MTPENAFLQKHLLLINEGPRIEDEDLTIIITTSVDTHKYPLLAFLTLVLQGEINLATVWMYHRGSMHNKINRLLERVLRTSYTDNASRFLTPFSSITASG